MLEQSSAQLSEQADAPVAESQPNPAVNTQAQRVANQARQGFGYNNNNDYVPPDQRAQFQPLFPSQDNQTFQGSNTAPPQGNAPQHQIPTSAPANISVQAPRATTNPIHIQQTTTYRTPPGATQSGVPPQNSTGRGGTSHNHSTPRRPLQPPPSFNRNYREQRADSSRYKPRLKVSDIGYWDPRAPKNDKEEESKKRLRISVELFVKRLRKLGNRYGEQAVVNNLDAALVNVSSWLTSLTEEDEEECTTLDGWISILLRDWSEPDVILRQKAKDYTCTDAHDYLEFYIEKLSKLQIAGMDRQSDQYYEIWCSLPSSWKATIPMKGSLQDMKSSLQQREIASGWPKKSSHSSKSSDSGYDSTSATSKKRGGSSSGYGTNCEFAKKSKSTNSNREIPACLICKRLGKGDSNRHWHDDCPNRSAAKAQVNALKLI